MRLLKKLFSVMASKKNNSSAIQALYDLCTETFTPFAVSPPSPTAIHKLSSLLAPCCESLPSFTRIWGTLLHTYWLRHNVLVFSGPCYEKSTLQHLRQWQSACTSIYQTIKRANFADGIGPADVGLSDASKEDDRGHGPFGIFSFNRVDRWAQPLTYVDIHEGRNFTMCMFCFPTSSVIPLHDHPSMTVLSKVLYGSLHVKAYDWVEPPRIRKIQGTEHSTVRLAKLAVDKVLTAPCSTSILYPRSGGNLHCFTAITPCAVLDILAPPYDEFAGRRCSYYRDYTSSGFSTEDDISGIGKEEEYAWLAEIDTPDDLYMRPGTYTGPPVEK